MVFLLVGMFHLLHYPNWLSLGNEEHRLCLDGCTTEVSNIPFRVSWLHYHSLEIPYQVSSWDFLRLWWQGDNTVKELRNSLTGKLACLMTSFGYFNVVSHQHLTVGHTHEDVGFLTKNPSMLWNALLSSKFLHHHLIWMSWMCCVLQMGQWRWWQVHFKAMATCRPHVMSSGLVHSIIFKVLAVLQPNSVLT